MCDTAPSRYYQNVCKDLGQSLMTLHRCVTTAECKPLSPCALMVWVVSISELHRTSAPLTC